MPVYQPVKGSAGSDLINIWKTMTEQQLQREMASAAEATRASIAQAQMQSEANLAGQRNAIELHRISLDQANQQRMLGVEQQKMMLGVEAHKMDMEVQKAKLANEEADLTAKAEAAKEHLMDRTEAINDRTSVLGLVNGEKGKKLRSSQISAQSALTTGDLYGYLSSKDEQATLFDGEISNANGRIDSLTKKGLSGLPDKFLPPTADMEEARKVFQFRPLDANGLERKIRYEKGENASGQPQFKEEPVVWSHQDVMDKLATGNEEDRREAARLLMTKATVGQKKAMEELIAKHSGKDALGALDLAKFGGSDVPDTEAVKQIESGVKNPMTEQDGYLKAVYSGSPIYSVLDPATGKVKVDSRGQPMILRNPRQKFLDDVKASKNPSTYEAVKKVFEVVPTAVPPTAIAPELKTIAEVKTEQAAQTTERGKAQADLFAKANEGAKRLESLREIDIDNLPFPQLQKIAREMGDVFFQKVNRDPKLTTNEALLNDEAHVRARLKSLQTSGNPGFDLLKKAAEFFSNL